MNIYLKEQYVYIYIYERCFTKNSMFIAFTFIPFGLHALQQSKCQGTDSKHCYQFQLTNDAASPWSLEPDPAGQMASQQPEGDSKTTHLLSPHSFFHPFTLGGTQDRCSSTFFPSRSHLLSSSPSLGMHSQSFHPLPLPLSSSFTSRRRTHSGSR